MATIKITELTSIGANLTSSTVIPVVNMSGTPTTEKTLLGNIANVVLAGAGGNYTAAAISVLAQSVTNAAQPNITSTGTLTNLTVSGNVAVNGDITSNGTAYVGNLSTTGIASITTLSVGATANLGAVSNITITGGTVGQVLSTDGNGVLSWASDATTYGNSNVAAYLPTYTGNIGADVVTANLFVGSGANLTNLAGANVSGFVPNANIANTAFAVAAANVSGLGNIATLNLDGNVSNLLTGNGTYVAIPVVPTVGNIATLNLDGNNQTWLAGNGVFANIAIPSVGNIATLNLDGNVSNVLRGDGTFGAGSNSSYGDSNVVSLLSAFGSNNVSTTGNITVGDLNVTGNVSSDLLPNANITHDLGSSTQRWKDIWLANSTIHLGEISLSVSNSGQLLTSEFIEGGEGIGGIAYIQWTTASELSIRTDNVSPFIATFESLKINDSFTLLTGANGAFPSNTNVFVSGAVTQTTPVSGFIDFIIPVDDVPVSNIFVYTFDLTRSPITEFSQLTGNTINLGNTSITSNGNSIVVDSLTVLSSNSITLGNAIISSNGNSLIVDSIQLTNGNIGTVGNIASINLDGNVSNLLTGNGTYVAIPTVPTVGNIATLNLDGSNSNVLYGNGIFAAIPAPTVTQDITSNGNMSIMLYDGNIKYSNNATVEPVSGNIAGNNISASGNISALNIGNITPTNLDGNVSNVLTGNGTFVALPVINANTVVWSTAPVANTSNGTAGQAAYDPGGNLYVCVATDTWSKFIGTTSW